MYENRRECRRGFSLSLAARPPGGKIPAPFLPPSRDRPDVEYSRMRKRRRCFSNGRRRCAAHGRSSVIPLLPRGVSRPERRRSLLILACVDVGLSDLQASTRLNSNLEAQQTRCRSATPTPHFSRANEPGVRFRVRVWVGLRIRSPFRMRRERREGTEDGNSWTASLCPRAWGSQPPLPSSSPSTCVVNSREFNLGYLYFLEEQERSARRQVGNEADVIVFGRGMSPRPLSHDGA